jgi:hypothetical protein
MANVEETQGPPEESAGVAATGDQGHTLKGDEASAKAKGYVGKAVEKVKKLLGRGRK